MFEHIIPAIITTVDISIVALLLYAVLVFLERTGSLLIFRGILSLFVIYLISSVVNLPLTHTLFTVFFSFFVVMLVVVFQRELRGFFEDFAVSLSSLFNGQHLFSQDDETIVTIAETVEHLAKKKTGALIVLPGKIPVSRFLKGGFNVNGEVNSALLLSIFDASTPGHDGAVVIENNEIKKFAVHLPLAEHFDKYKKYGTRHRAALGLSERTDAMIIVVSEEHGTIMLAENNKLEEADGLENLTELLRTFYGKHAIISSNQALSGVFTYRIKEKVLAVLLSILAWFVIVGR